MTNSNKVFVSPGIYTSEKDITFVAQSIGVTTLGLVGETLKGPAFEPILISNFDEFKVYFGNTSPDKDGLGNPKFELPYTAKSYLEQSNQLFVTRVLGLSGYKPNKTFGIKTIGGITVDTNTNPTTTSGSLIPTLTGITGSTFYSELSGKTSIDGTTSVTDYIVSNYSGLTSNGDYFTIGYVPISGTTGFTGNTLSSPIGSNTNKNWYNNFYNQTGATISTVDGVYSYVFGWTGGTAFNVTRYKYPASQNTKHNNITVAALRSRGRYSNQNLILEVTGNTSFQLNAASNSDVTTNPLGEFTINVTGVTGGAKEFTCSLDTTSSKYITKVLGSKVYDKGYASFPIYVHEVYPNFVSSAYANGDVLGLSLSEVYESNGNDFLKQWDTPISPMVVSEVRGGNVADLFQVITISDGEDANTQVKISIINIDLDTGEFDVLVRDFNDTDANQVVLEKYGRCSMNPQAPSYIGRKIGTSDGEFELRSKYIMLAMADDHPTDAIPAGFNGYIVNSSFSGTTLGDLNYKTTYYNAGDILGYEADGTVIISGGDKVKKVSLGVSSTVGFDADLLKFKGESAIGVTHGFHLSTNASTITGSTLSGYKYQTTSYDLEGINKDKLANINYRKFTFVIAGGFDGWDIYRNTRTNTDDYIFGKTVYVSGSTTNNGVFNSTVGNSDYYAYLEAINTFANPEAIDINVFATPGINFYNHSSLINATIDMIEGERADSIYIINSPNISGETAADQVSDLLSDIAIDSNYSATYWPWIQVRDTDNATQLYIPPTGEVLRNIALTDNVSYPWFAVAGYNRGLVKSIKASKKLTLDERDTLYKNRINPIATFSDTGTIIWGNKTLQEKESALDRLNVRRLLLRARKLISAVAVRLLFEQNDEVVRNEFLRLVNPILESIKKERGLTEFKVTVSNDPEDIDANTLRGKIYLKPSRSLEFIDLSFILTPTGASFDNV